MDDAFRCQDVVVRFTTHFDLGEHEQMLALFAPEGVWHRREGEIHGRNALREFLLARGDRWVTRHLLTNVHTVHLDGTCARVHSYVTAYRTERKVGQQIHALDKPLLVGRYHDELVRMGDAWLIASRAMIEDLR